MAFDIEYAVPPPQPEIRCKPDRMPLELREMRQWVVWKYVAAEDGKKWRKVPCNPRSGKAVSPTEPDGWGTYTEVVRAHGTECYAGLGFALTEDDDIVALDIDGCIDPVSGEISDVGLRSIDSADSYTEVSPSGTGIRILLKGKKPEGRCKRGSLEMYDRARFVTLTGRRISDTPKSIEARQDAITALHAEWFGGNLGVLSTAPPRNADSGASVLDDERLVRMARASRRSEKFRQLFDDGDLAAYGGDESAADLALANELVFWTNHDLAQADRLFRLSPLYRDKWDEMRGSETYGAMTLAKASAGNPHGFTGRSLPDTQNAGGGDWNTLIPFGTHDLPTFPLNVFPDWAAKMCQWVEISIQAPADAPAMLLVALVAMLIANVVRVFIKRTFTVPCNVFSASIMPPGSRKSAVFAAIMASARLFEHLLQKRMAPAISAYDRRKEVLELRRKALLSLARRQDVPSDLEASLQQVDEELAALVPLQSVKMMLGDVTPEKLVEEMADNQGRAAIFSPEAGLFDMMAGKYSKVPNLEPYLQGYDSEEYREDRKGHGQDERRRGGILIERPALNIGVMVQPVAIKGLLNNKICAGRGIVQRFMYSLPRKMSGKRKTGTPDIPDNVMARYENAIHYLGEFYARFSHDEAATVLCLTAEARSAIEDFELEIDGRIGDGGDLQPIAEWASKLHGLVIRIAGILHVMDSVERTEAMGTSISATTIDRAIEVGRYLIPHSMAVLLEMGFDTREDAAKDVLNWVQGKDLREFQTRDCQTGVWRCRSYDDATSALRVLHDRGYIRPGFRMGQSGKQQHIWEVNPIVHIGGSTPGDVHISLPLEDAVCVTEEVGQAHVSFDGGVEDVEDEDSTEAFMRNLAAWGLLADEDDNEEQPPAW